jgi:hypothetical protein
VFWVGVVNISPVCVHPFTWNREKSRKKRFLLRYLFLCSKGEEECAEPRKRSKPNDKFPNQKSIPPRLLNAPESKLLDEANWSSSPPTSLGIIGGGIHHTHSPSVVYYSGKSKKNESLSPLKYYVVWLIV